MLLSPGKNGLTSLNEEVRVFKECDATTISRTACLEEGEDHPNPKTGSSERTLLRTSGRYTTRPHSCAFCHMKLISKADSWFVCKVRLKGWGLSLRNDMATLLACMTFHRETLNTLLIFLVFGLMSGHWQVNCSRSCCSDMNRPHVKPCRLSHPNLEGLLFRRLLCLLNPSAAVANKMAWHLHAQAHKTQNAGRDPLCPMKWLLVPAWFPMILLFSCWHLL